MTWRQLPPTFGASRRTVFRRFTEWSAERVRTMLHCVLLDELGTAGELDWSRCTIDSVNVRANKGGLMGPRILMNPDRRPSARPLVDVWS